MHAGAASAACLTRSHTLQWQTTGICLVPEQSSPQPLRNFGLLTVGPNGQYPRYRVLPCTESKMTRRFAGIARSLNSDPTEALRNLGPHCWTALAVPSAATWRRAHATRIKIVAPRLLERCRLEVRGLSCTAWERCPLIQRLFSSENPLSSQPSWAAAGNPGARAKAPAGCVATRGCFLRGIRSCPACRTAPVGPGSRAQALVVCRRSPGCHPPSSPSSRLRGPLWSLAPPPILRSQLGFTEAISIKRVASDANYPSVPQVQVLRHSPG